MTQQSSVAIGEASQILGVSEAALRQWTDAGQIKAFVTPGGHRRYSRAELKKFIASSQKVLNIKDLLAELEDTVKRNRESIRANPNTTFWYNRLSQESQEHMGNLSRRFLHLVISYVSEPAKQEENLKLADDICRDYGETLAKLGLPLADCVYTYTRYRESVMNAMIHLMKKGEPVNVRIVEAILLVGHVMDVALVSLVAAYQRYKDESRDESRGMLTGDSDNASAL